MNIPNHVAIILMATDAGRKRRGCPEITAMCRAPKTWRSSAKKLTGWDSVSDGLRFFHENWNRPQDEVTPYETFAQLHENLFKDCGEEQYVRPCDRG